MLNTEKVEFEADKNGSPTSTGSKDSKNAGQDVAEEDSVDTFSLLIIKSNAQSMKGAETFLRNRKWELYASTNLKEALAIMIQKNPKFVMVTVDHPNKKVRILPKVLKQAFPVTIIMFAELQTNSSIAALNDPSVEYAIFPPVSGPAVERTILKIIRDQKKRDKENKERIARGEAPLDEKDQVISIKGGLGSAQSGDSTSLESARAALTQLMNSDLDGPNDSPGGPSFVQSDDLQRSGGTIVQKGTRAQGGSTVDHNDRAQMNSAQQDGANSPYFNGSSGGPEGNNFNHPQGAGNPLDPNNPYGSGQKQGGFGKSNLNQQNPLGENDSGVQYPFNEDEEGGFQPTSMKKKYQPIEYGSKKDSKGKTPQYYDPDEYDPATRPQFDSEEVKRRLLALNKEHQKQKPIHANDSLILKGTQKALDESVIVRQDVAPSEVKGSVNVSCITVESSRFSGYLIAALGENRKVDQEFIEMVRTRLFTFLRENGEQVRDDESMEIRLQEIDFKDWALEQAEFLRKSIHNGNEVAMAFFPTQSTNVELTPSKNEKMVQLRIEDLKADVPVEFDLYIYLPENNRYLLYTPQGRTFLGVQKDRLKEKGVTHMHLRKENSQSVKKYQAQNYLNDKIASYRQNIQERDINIQETPLAR